MKTIKRKLARLSINQRLVFDLVRKNGRLTRKDISRVAGLKTSTTVKLVSELIREGFLKETRTGNTRPGRRPASLQLDGDMALVIGIDLGRTGIRGALTNLNGGPVHEVEVGIEKGSDSARVMKKMTDMIEGLSARSGDREVIGIGIGVSGVIDFGAGTCLFATGLPDFENIPIRDIVEKRFKIPAFVDDSSRTHAVGEKYFGLGQGLNNFMYVSLGEGIGSGIFINGAVYRGKNGISGEIGHVVMDRNGPRCKCGNHGCLEQYASGSAIAGQIREALRAGVQSTLQKVMREGDGDAITAEAVTEAARQDDRLAAGVLERAGERVGQVLASVVSILAPERIIIGGGVGQAGDFILEPIRRMVKSESVGLLTRGLGVEISALREKAGTLGAARMAMIEFFEGENAWRNDWR